MEKNIKKVDAYLRDYKISDESEIKYYLSFSYNGLDFSKLYQDKETELFAIDFKWKYLNGNYYADKHTFTDNKGNPSTKRDYFSVISSIKGIEEIDDAVRDLVIACVNLEVQADLTIHYNDKEYPLVSDTDNKIYFPSDRLKVSKKGYSIEQLTELKKDIRNIKKESKNVQKKKTNI